MDKKSEKKKKKILIVDDEDALRNALVDRFSLEEDIDILSARDGVEGFEMAMKHRPDLVLLDIYMPKKDGLSVFRDMKHTQWGKDISVIFISNSRDLSGIAMAGKVGLFDYLVKSDWSIEDIVTRTRKRLGIYKEK